MFARSVFIPVVGYCVEDAGNTIPSDAIPSKQYALVHFKQKKETLEECPNVPGRSWCTIQFDIRYNAL